MIRFIITIECEILDLLILIKVNFFPLFWRNFNYKKLNEWMRNVLLPTLGDNERRMVVQFLKIVFFLNQNFTTKSLLSEPVNLSFYKV